jgi:hypothetical protein
MAESVVDIEQVEPDIDPMMIGTILNPLTEDFVHAYAGKDITVPAATVTEGSLDGKKKGKVEPGKVQYPLPVCIHIAKHLAEKIIRAEHHGKIAEIADEKRRDEESRKAIPDYKGKIFEKMKELVITDSDFFGKEGMKESFIR